MLYDKRFSEERKSRELELLWKTLSEVNTSYCWVQVKKLLQDRVFPWCEKFGTWSSSRVRVDRVPNKKVSQQKEESSVLGPQNVGESRPSPNRKVQTLNNKIGSVLGPQRKLGEGTPSPEWESTRKRPSYKPIPFKSSTASAATPLVSAVIPDIFVTNTCNPFTFEFLVNYLAYL